MKTSRTFWSVFSNVTKQDLRSYTSGGQGAPGCVGVGGRLFHLQLLRTSAADHNQPPDSQNRVWDREARCSHYCARTVPTETKIAWPLVVVPRSTVPGTCSWTQRTIESSTRASNDALGHGNGKLHQKSEKHFSQSALWVS